MSQIHDYYYNKQIRRYIIQFMEIFRNLQCHTGIREDGEIRVMTVPISYGSKDRVTAAVLHKNTQNSPIRLPTMSTYVRAINMAPEMRKGIGGVRRETFLPKGGIMPDDIKTVRQLMPIPYTIDVDLSIWTSNSDQQFQIIEQILMYFDPILQIQTSDEKFDWTKITMVELTNLSFDEQFPIGTERRIIVTTLTFKLPIYISGPNELKASFVNDIYARISAVSDNFDEFYGLLPSTEDDEYTLIATGDVMKDP